jgi:hypothetical protein
MLASKEHRVCSQNGEDGIIDYILSVIGEGGRFCVEFGFGNQANTLNLLSNKKWSGVLIDCNPKEYVTGLSRYCDRKDVTIKLEAVTPDNINLLFKETNVPEVIDVLSIDIDGMDLHVFKALEGYKIRLLVIEYNASLGPDASITVPYIKDFNRMNFHPEYHGASLKALTKIAESKGLKLVGVDSSGINAFYIQQDMPVEAVSVEKAFMNHAKRNGKWQDQFKDISKFKFEEV